MKPIDQIESEPGIELKWTYDWVWIIKMWEKTFLTNLDENWQPFMLNWEPLVIDIEEWKKVASVINTWIINLVNNKGPHNEDLKIDSECITRFKIIVEDNKPLIVASSYGEEFLVLPIIVNKHLVLSNSDISHVVESLEQIETDVYVSEKNNDFAVWLNINDWKYYLYLKNENGYEKVDLTSINKENIFSELLDVPSKDTISIIWGRIVAFDEEKKVFYEIELPFDYKNAVFCFNEYIVFSPNWEKFGFTASRENPKEPNILDLNGTKLLLSDKNETLDKKGNKFYTIIYWMKKSHKDMIYLDDFFEIEWVRFYRFWINDKKTFTDWKDVYKLECDTEWKVKLVNFEWKESPYKISDSYNPYWLRNYTKILNNSWWKRELIPAIKKTIIEENDWKEEAKEIYERLKLDDEQKKLNIVWISDEHWVVCLASDVTNRSRFRFYRINPDNTLTYVFSDNSEIHFDEEKKIVKVIVGFWYDKYFEIIRKPNSSSILDPILIDWKEYYLVKTKDWKTSYVKLNSEKNWFEFSLWEFEVDSKDLLPVQSQSFEFNSKTIYLKENWIVVIWEEKYQLCDVNWENTDKPENSITLVGNIKVLLLKNTNNSSGNNWNIYWYVEWDDTSKIIDDDIRFNEIDRINYCISHCHSWIKKINIWWKECICLCYYKEQNAISIVEDKEWKINRRYLCWKVSEWNDKNNIIIEWEEYDYNWKPVCVIDLLWKEYVKWEDWNVYYNKWQWKELKMVTFPDNIEVWNVIYCEPKNYYNLVDLKTSKWKAVKLKWQENLYYTDKETHKQKITINWVNYAIYTFFNASANRLEQFKKVWEEYQPFGLWWTKNVLLIDNYLYIWLPHEKEPRQINIYNWIIQATTKYNEKVIFSNDDNNAKFRYGINWVSWDYMVYAVKKVWNNYFAVSCKEKWFKVSIDNNWDIKLDWIMYDEKKMEALYKIMTKDIWVPETVSWVTGEVEGIMK